jgi:hypothetical protein
MSAAHKLKRPTVINPDLARSTLEAERIEE